jgi:hypothetical protein
MRGWLTDEANIEFEGMRFPFGEKDTRIDRQRPKLIDWKSQSPSRGSLSWIVINAPMKRFPTYPAVYAQSQAALVSHDKIAAVELRQRL